MVVLLLLVLLLLLLLVVHGVRRVRRRQRRGVGLVGRSELLLWSVVLVHRVVESVDRAWLVGRRHWRGKRWRTHSGQRLLLGKRVLV